MTVDFKEYESEKLAFIGRHNHDYRIETTPMDDYGVYYHNYLFADGAIWSEKMEPVNVEEVVEIKKCRVTVNVKMLRTEFWSTETPSKYLYERF